jgi:hypothetical protein
MPPGIAEHPVRVTVNSKSFDWQLLETRCDQRIDCSTCRMMNEGETLRLEAILNNVLSEGLFSPRSSCPMYVL